MGKLIMSSFNLFKELGKVCSNSVCSNCQRTFHPKTETFPKTSILASTCVKISSPQLYTISNAKMTSVVRQNYHQECEAGINKQVNMELHAHYVYLSMALYFDRDDVALPGFAKYFKKASAEEAEHAEKFMKHQQDEWGSPLDAMKAALELEKTVNQSIIDLHALAGVKEDGNLTDFLEDFLEEQVEGIKAVADLATRITRAGPGLGEIIMDKEVAEL